MAFRIDPQGHRIEASSGGNTWAYVADARIGLGLAVVGERVLIGTHGRLGAWPRPEDGSAEMALTSLLPAHRPDHSERDAHVRLAGSWRRDLGTDRCRERRDARRTGRRRPRRAAASRGWVAVWAKTITKTTSKIPRWEGRSNRGEVPDQRGALGRGGKVGHRWWGAPGPPGVRPGRAGSEHLQTPQREAPGEEALNLGPGPPLVVGQAGRFHLGQSRLMR